VKLLLIFCFTTLISASVDANPFVQDSTASMSYDSMETVQRLRIPIASPDSSEVVVRAFDDKTIGELKSDSNLNYEQPPTVVASLWDRFLAWLVDLLELIFRKAFATDWGNLIVYLLGLALLIFVIMTLLKVDALKILFSAEGSQSKIEIFEENIHEMDFEQLINEAITEKDYRRGIRLLFLYSLKLLSDKHLIRWESGKTNHEYVAELKLQDLKTGLNELSFYFDYAWYGNFVITQETFGKAQNVFRNWREKVK
jgi:hypothetical protein